MSMSQTIECSAPIEFFKLKVRSAVLAIGILASAGCTDQISADPTPPVHIEATDGIFGGNVAGYDWGGTMNPEAVIDNLQRIGARYNVFNPALYMQDGIILEEHFKTPQLDDVTELAARSKEAGLPMIIKPIVEVEEGGQFSWRGEIVPEDADAWFNTYTQAVEQQYGAAYSQGARTLVIGTELSSLEGEEHREHWETLIIKIAEQFPGTAFVYDQNWDRMGIDPAFIHMIDRLDYSLYQPVKDGVTFAEHWRDVAARIKKLEKETGIPRGAGEFGIALTGTPGAPNQENKQQPLTVMPNPDLVAEYIGEACKAFDEQKIPHALWGTYTHSLIVGGIDLDAQRGFFVSSPDNQELGHKILEVCVA